MIDDLRKEHFVFLFGILLVENAVTFVSKSVAPENVAATVEQFTVICIVAFYAPIATNGAGTIDHRKRVVR
jgi:hypothetical protein